MGAVVFGNEFFDQWLNQKSNEILAKVEKERISTEDMLILSLKAQVNHFHHMDIEFREEFRKIDIRFSEMLDNVNGRFGLMERRFQEVDKRFEEVYKRFEQVDKRFEQVDKRFEQVDKRFEQVDKRLDRMTTIMMWGFGFMSTLMVALKFFV